MLIEGITGLAVMLCMIFMLYGGIILWYVVIKPYLVDDNNKVYIKLCIYFIIVLISAFFAYESYSVVTGIIDVCNDRGGNMTYVFI